MIYHSVRASEQNPKAVISILTEASFLYSLQRILQSRMPDVSVYSATLMPLPQNSWSGYTKLAVSAN